MSGNVTNPEKNLHASFPPALLARAEEAAQQDHVSLDEFAAEAFQRQLARRMLERFKREGELRRRGMTDEEVENTVEQAVHEHRQEERERQNKERGR